MPADQWNRVPGSTREAIRTALAARLPASCSICGNTVNPSDEWDADHVVPLDRGGGLTDMGNLAPAHRACNRRQGADLANDASTVPGNQPSRRSSMSDEAGEKEPQGTPPADPQGSQQEQEPQGTSEKPQQPEKSDVDWQAEARKWEQRAKKDAKATAELRDQVKRLIDPDEAQQQVKSVEEQMQAVTVERDQALAQAAAYELLLAATPDGMFIPPDKLTWAAKRVSRAPADEAEDDAKQFAESVAIPLTAKVGTPHARTGAGENGSSPEPFDVEAVVQSARSQRVF